MAALVTEAGYETLEAESGAEAVRLAEANAIDLLISDVQMPGMSGPELIMMLQGKGLIRRSLLVTGNADSIDRCADYQHSVPLLKKPFSGCQFLGTIRNMLGD